MSLNELQRWDGERTVRWMNRGSALHVHTDIVMYAYMRIHVFTCLSICTYVI